MGSLESDVRWYETVDTTVVVPVVTATCGGPIWRSVRHTPNLLALKFILEGLDESPSYGRDTRDENDRHQPTFLSDQVPGMHQYQAPLKDEI